MADEADESTAREAAGPTVSADDEDERYRGATPPGYDWPTHGGYLGCLLGTMTGCLLAPLGYIVFGFLGAFLVHPLGGFGVALAVILTAGAYLAVFIGLTRLGWFMGKRFLREYEQPARPVWGEDDEEDYPRIVDADPPTTATPSAADAPSAEAPPQTESAS